MNQREYDDPINALKAELASISPSPAFQSRVRQRIAGELDLLREELAAVTPSTEFAVRVRQGVEAATETRKASWLSGWRWAVPAGAVAAGVIAAIVLTRSGDDTPERVTVQAPTVQAPEASTMVETPAATTNDERRTANAGQRAPDERVQVVATAPTIADPMLEVITNQPAVLRALRPGANAVESGANAVTSTGPEVIADLFVAPIEVSPIVVKWMVEPPSPPGAPGGSSIIRRVTADTAERSAK